MENKPSEEELRDMLKEGKTLYQISRHFNTTIPEIFKLGRSYGISFDYYHNHIPRPTKQDLESMYTDEGMHQWQISREFGVDQGNISVWLRKHNIPTRGPNGTLRVPMPPKEVLERMYHNEHMTQEQIGKEFDVSQFAVYTWLCKYGIQAVVSKIPPKEVLEQMYTIDGMTQEQISREFGVDESTIYVWIRKYGIPTRGSTGTLNVPIPPKEVIEQMYTDEGMTQYQISREFNVDDVTVHRWIRKYGIPTRGSTGTLVVPMPPKDDLLNYINDGLNQLQIAERYGVHDSTIFKWCNYYGIPGMVNSYRCTTSEHQEWRHAVFDRDHRTCQMCGTTNAMLQAHHIVPYTDHPEIGCELENGITLCIRCHRSIKGREYEYLEQFAAITQPHLHNHEVI